MEKPEAKQSTKNPQGPTFWQRLPFLLYFGVVGRLAPKVAAASFIRIFCTPPRSELKPPHKALLARATTFSYTIPSILEKGKHITLTGYTWGDVNATKRVLLLHGWRGKAADFYKLIPELEKEGYCIEAIDQPAHGASEGKYCSAISMEKATRLYVQQRGMPYAIVAHSLGAASCVLALCGPGRQPLTPMPERLLLLTHPVVLENSFLLAFNLLGLPMATRRAVYPYTQTQFGLSMDDVNLLKLTKPLPAKTLSVYVPADEEVPRADTEAFLAQYSAVQSLFVKNGDHARIMRHSQVVDACLAFLA